MSYVMNEQLLYNILKHLVNASYLCRDGSTLSSSQVIIEYDTKLTFPGTVSRELEWK